MVQCNPGHAWLAFEPISLLEISDTLMFIEQFFGYIGALIIGLILGLIGGGGSILTVPVMVYIMGIAPVLATAYSLFVVGATSAVGALQNSKKGLLEWKTGIVFAIPALISVYSTRKWIMPAIPDHIMTIGSFEISKSIAIMLLFAIIMIIAAITMIRSNCLNCDDEEAVITYNYPMILLEGTFVGLLTGLIGAGGGFLIIPALVVFAHLPMKKAIATSLLIIAIKSLIGFVGDIENLDMDWTFLMSFTFLSIIGIFAGMYLSKYVKGAVLKKAFGWFVLIMGILIIVMEMR
ncbi:MAG TPA: sulfite exporter TauE/SafE family protein [Saprospiraceae bacterium]|nr:sulfite exporter TauE/SafE family protein [Saprospiraceae bacterium]